MSNVSRYWTEQTRKLTDVQIPTKAINLIDKKALRLLKELDEYGLLLIGNIPKK